MDTPAMAQLSALAEQAAAAHPDLIAALADAIKGAVTSDADPYLLMGTLIEGETQTLSTIPPERQGDTAKAAVRLLFDRLRAEGLL
jgi:hypothetical protein